MKKSSRNVRLVKDKFSTKDHTSILNMIDEPFCIVEMIFDENDKPIDNCFLEVNSAFERQTGLTDVVGKRMSELVPTHENEWFEIFGKVALTGNPIRFQRAAKNVNRFYDVYAFRVGQVEKRQVAILFNDITHRKHAEKAIVLRQNKLERLVKECTAELEEKATQLSRLSTQLTLAEQRERRRLAEIIHDHVQQLIVSARFHVEALAERLKNGNETNCNKIIHILSDCEKIMRSLNAQLSPNVLYERGLKAGMRWLVRNMADMYKLRIDTHIDSSILVERDDVKVLLFESVREILFNAAKHAGTSSVSIKMVKDDKENVCITISDQGVGFNPKHLFKNTRDDTRFGLLSIRERLEIIGGKLKIESSPGKGSAFHLIVPMKNVVDNFVSEGDNCNMTFGGVNVIRVFLADDHTVMREGLSSLLGCHSDIKVIGEAENGEEAVQKVRQLKPEVVLMDIKMPQMDGIEATRLIHLEFPDIKIIGLSMFHEEELVNGILNAGAVAFVNKNEPSSVLLKAIRNSMDQS
ncbi:MAG: response regulator [Syntrophales bacterium]|nr:response regulator [Syntrophales bacterium]